MKNQNLTLRVLAAFATLTLATSSAHAAIAVWDGGGANDTFSTQNNWNPNTAPVSGTDEITFAGAIRLTPDLTAGYTAVSLQSAGTTAAGAVLFNSTASSFTLGSSNGSVLTLNSGAAGSASTNGIINASGNLQTISANVVINNTGGSTGSTVIGSNNAGGNLNLSGTLTATTATNFSSNTASTTTVGTLLGAATINIAGNIGNAGTTVFNDATGYTGGINVNAGNLYLGSDMGGSGALTLGGTAGVAATYLRNGVNLNNNVTIAPPNGANVTRVLGMTDTGTSTFSGNLTNNDADTLNLQLSAVSASTVIFSGVVSGSRPIEKTGAGTVALTNALNTNTGGLRISAGTLQFSTDRNLGALTNGIELAGGTLDSTASVANSTSASHAWTISANSAITMSGTVANSHLTIAGNMTGSGNLAISSPNASNNLILSGNNTGYTGAYTVNSGRLQVTSTNTTISANNNVTLATLGTLVVGGGGTVNIGNLNGTGSGVVQATNNTGDTSTLVVNQTVDGSVSNAFNNNGTGILAITKAGAANLTLTGSNSYTGQTTISAGTLRAENNKALGNTILLSITGGTLDVRGTTAGTLTLGTAANISLSTGTINFQLGTAFDSIVSNAAGAFTISGGTFALNVAGAGFDYANTYAVLSGFGGSNSVSGLGFTGYDTGSYTASLSNAGVLSFTVVPEPATWALLAGSLTVLMVSRRRRRD